MKNTVNRLKSSNIIIEPLNEKDLWEDTWNIYLKKDDVLIGTASFAGEKARGTVPVSIRLDEKYQNQGIGTECFKMLVDWAFLHSEVYEVTAQCNHENDKCIYALEKAGFVIRQSEESIETYSIKKPKTTWLGLYVLIGFIAGFLIGIVFANLWLGLVIGLVIGVLMGLNMDSDANKKREKITGKGKE